MVQPFGDDFPIKTMMNQASGEQGSVVIKFTQIYHNIYIHTYIHIIHIYIYVHIGGSHHGNSQHPDTVLMLLLQFFVQLMVFLARRWGPNDGWRNEACSGFLEMGNPPKWFTGWWFQPTPLKNMKSVGMMTFPTEWKVIKFHGSKPPIRSNQNI